MPTSHKQLSITALILAGGRGSRIDGRDKGLALFKGKPLIRWTIDCLKSQTKQIVISCNRNMQQYSKFDYPVVIDNQAESYAGPIAGILAAQKRIHTGFLLVVPCDTPNLPMDFVAIMYDSLSKSATEVAIVDDGERLQNLHLLLHNDRLASLQDYFDAGGRSIRGWLDQSNTIRVDYTKQPECFTNINTVSQLTVN